MRAHCLSLNCALNTVLIDAIFFKLTPTLLVSRRNSNQVPT
uniref:Uncharacterized protein n=1 Tax=Lepeophtheirus salmonis TaxID=72036 RepID=A0A0K2U9X6_LEPSM